MEIKMVSGKWTKIISCYKDAFLKNVYMLGKQVLEFELYNGSSVNKPLINSCTFQLTVLQPNTNNNITGLQKLDIDSNYQACYNVITDDKNRKIVEIYVKNDNISTAYLNVKKCPNINLFKFYANSVPVSDVDGKIEAENVDVNPKIETESITFPHTEGNNSYQVILRKYGQVVWYKISITYIDGSLTTTIPNTNIPFQFRPVDSVYNQRVGGISGTTLINTSITFNTNGTINISSNNNTNHSLTGIFVTTN